MSDDISMYDEGDHLSPSTNDISTSNPVQLSVHDSRRRLNVTTANDLFQKQAPNFSGEINAVNFTSCKREIKDWKEVLFDQLPPYIAMALLKSKLLGEAAQLVANVTFPSMTALIDQLEVHFPQHAYRNDVITMLATGHHFRNYKPKQCVEEARRLYCLISQESGSNSGASAVC